MLVENCKYHYRTLNSDLSINKMHTVITQLSATDASSIAQLATVAKQVKDASPKFCNIITDDPCWLRARRLWLQQAGQRSD